MINLLPHETKQQIRAARTNVLLLRYIFIILAAVAFLGIAIGGIHVILTGMKANAQSTIDANSAKTDEFGSIQSQTQALKASVDSARKVLDEEVVYTELITSIARLTPKGVVLNKLTLNPQTIGTPTTIQAYATNTDTALSLKDSYQGSPVFSNVSIQNISSSAGISGYPVNIILNVTINKGAS